MLTTKSRKTLALLIAASLLAALAVAVLTIGGRGSTAVAQEATVPSSPIHLAALRAAPSDQAVPFLEHDWLAESGYDVASGRVLATNAAGSQVIAIPRTADSADATANELCVIVTSADDPARGGGGCDSVDHFNAKGVFVTLGSGKPDTDEVVGILPDGFDSIAVHSPDDATRTLQVEGNVVRFLSKGASSATLAGPDGPVDQNLAGGLDE